MSSPEHNGTPTRDWTDVRRALASSSTKIRREELGLLEEKISSQAEPSSSIATLALQAIQETYAYYIDRQSRQASEQCLVAIFCSSDGQHLIPAFAKFLEEEGRKASKAPGSALVLLRWATLLMQYVSKSRIQWDASGSSVITAVVYALDTVLSGSNKGSPRTTAYRVTRRAIRSLAQSDFAPSAVEAVIIQLCAKSTGPTSRNAPLLGVVAGVCNRLPGKASIVEAKKKEYIDYYVREHLGSRSQLPPYIAIGLHDFFASYMTEEDLAKDVIPAMERSLLRAPEIVLSNLIAPTLAALPPSLDLSSILAANLLKPLLSNVKSSNPLIRNGALQTFRVIATHSHDGKHVTKISEDIIDPLKTGKLTSPEQKSIHAQMLSALTLEASIARKMAPILAPVAAKEPNELAASAEIETLARYTTTILNNDDALEQAIRDTFVKGLTDKRQPLRRAWALNCADIIWTVASTKDLKGQAQIFTDSIVPKLLEILDEVSANPIAAVQTGQLVSACAVTAICLDTLAQCHQPGAPAVVQNTKLLERVTSESPKPSFLFSPKVYSKLSSPEELRWFQRALIAVFAQHTSKLPGKLSTAWSQSLIFSILSANATSRDSTENDALFGRLLSINAPLLIDSLVDGLWQWNEDAFLDTKDSSAAMAKGFRGGLDIVIHAVCMNSSAKQKRGIDIPKELLFTQMSRLLVLCQSHLISQAPWIDMCLRCGVDPGDLARDRHEQCLSEIIAVTEKPSWRAIPQFQAAAFAAAAELAFVARDVITPMIIAQIAKDLEVGQLYDIGPIEAAIYRTPEGVAYVDVLKKQDSDQVLSKNSRDYDIVKWEEELRAQLAKKHGEVKKLKADEQTKVNAQLKLESEIRSKVAIVDSSLRRGIGIINALATGPPSEADLWFAPAMAHLLDVVESGAGFILGDTAALCYLACADRIASRLGALRPFIGIATLRAEGVTTLPESLLVEPLDKLVTRVLYRLRFLGEQRPLDSVTLSYIFPLIFLVLQLGGVAEASGEDADEQIVLAIEFLSYHTEICQTTSLPRDKALKTLIEAMGRFGQHFRPIKDCFTDLCRSISVNLTPAETDTIVKGVTAQDLSVRGAVLQAISGELQLSGRTFYEEIWLACHDDVEEHAEIANEIWEENELKLPQDFVHRLIPYLDSKDAQIRRAASRALSSSTREYSADFADLLSALQDKYVECAKPRKPELDKYGMPIKKDLSDPWESRHGVSLTFKELAPLFPSESLVPFMHFLMQSGPLSDKHMTVRDSMVEAATLVITTRGDAAVESLMSLFESGLEQTSSTASQDLVNEAVVILYGALARHLPSEDVRLPKVIQRLLTTLSTPSESVQYAVAQCLPALIQASQPQAIEYLQQTIEETLHAKKYAARRGAAYGVAGIVKGRGISALKEARVLSTFRSAAENKKDPNERQGVFLAYELLSLLLGRLFEPYVIQVVPQLLLGFGDTNTDVREACLDAAKTCFATLSSFGVKQILPTLLEGLDDHQWRSKKGASDSLGAMAYLDPEQLAVSLPEIIPPLTEVLNDSHKEVRASANRSLQRFGEVISNPEVKSQVNILLKALSDPTKYTDDALDALIKVNFVHYLDAPSLALVTRILERGLGERSATKRKAAQIIGSLAHLTERKDLTSHLPILVAGLRAAVVDPVPTTRATASKALGSLVEKLGEDALPDLIPSLMQTLKSDTGAGDRLGSAQALSEVLAGLGTGRLEETLPTILQNVGSNKPSVREGFMSLFIFLPACFGNSFANYLARVIPPILAGLADDIEAIRETSLRAGRLLVKNFASRAVDLLLPELERGLADDSYRIRLSSVELVGDLLFNLTGISGKAEAEDMEENANEAGQSLLEVLGEEKRNRVLSALYICRCDTSGLVRTSAMAVWKALVASPRTLRELIPTLTQFLIRRLASSNMEQKVIASNALGELIRKAGEGVLATLLPTLEEGLRTSTDTDARQGICIALRELISSAAPESLEEYEKTLTSVVRTALVDPDDDVREAAAEAFDSLQRIFGKRIIEQVLPNLLNLLRSEDSADNALAALLTLLTEASRSNVILPNLLPTLLTSPISAFNARALASLAEVASTSMTRKLPTILNALMDNVVACRDEALKDELQLAFDTIIQAVDEFDGLNTMMSIMLTLVKHEDHRKRAATNLHFAKFFQSTEVDFSRYYPDLIRVLLISFDDSDPVTVQAAWTALNALTQKLRKEEMESLVIPTRQALGHVGVAGHNLPGFSLPKGINAILPIFLQGLMNGSTEQRTQAALALSDLIDRTSPEGLKPFVTQITGPLIRVVSERSTELKSAILLTLNNLLEKIPLFLKPFLPQLQRTFAKSLADPSSEVLRSRAAQALGTLITMTPRIDPLIAELVTGSRTTDAGVRNAMLKALYEVVSKAGANMSEASRNSILVMMDTEAASGDEKLEITYAKLLGALIKVLPAETAAGLLKSRVLIAQHTHSSVLNLNAVLVESSISLADSNAEVTQACIVRGIAHADPYISGNAVLAAGKYLLGDNSNKSFEFTSTIFEALSKAVQPGQAADTRRLALVVVRTVARLDNDLVRPHLAILTPAVFACVRDPIIPIKLSAEAAFLAAFSVVEQESAVFDKYMAGPGAALQPAAKRSMQEYFKRIALRLSSQARERREAEGGQGGLGLSSDEIEDEKEIWSIGRVEGTNVFSDD